MPSRRRYSSFTVSRSSQRFPTELRRRTSSDPVRKRNGSIRCSCAGLDSSGPVSGLYTSRISGARALPLMTTVPSRRDIPLARDRFCSMMGSGEKERVVLSYTSAT